MDDKMMIPDDDDDGNVSGEKKPKSLLVFTNQDITIH